DRDALFVGRLDAEKSGADAQQVHAVGDHRFLDLLTVQERAHVRVGVADDEIASTHRNGTVAYRQLCFRELHVTSRPADPEWVQANGENRIDCFVCTPGNDSDRSRRTERRRSMWVDGRCWRFGA